MQVGLLLRGEESEVCDLQKGHKVRNPSHPKRCRRLSLSSETPFPVLLVTFLALLCNFGAYLGIKCVLLRGFRFPSPSTHLSHLGGLAGPGDSWQTGLCSTG